MIFVKNKASLQMLCFMSARATPRGISDAVNDIFDSQMQELCRNSSSHVVIGMTTYKAVHGRFGFDRPDPDS